MTAPILPAFPYFGSKRAVAAVVWEALGDVANYVEPFCGSAAVLLARPHVGKVETVNEMSAWLTNFYRAVQQAPEEVARYAAWPVNEVDMQARHDFLNDSRGLVERCREDWEFYDARLAGLWVWGQSIWIGSGWCDHGHRNAGTRQRPQLSNAGTGTSAQRLHRKLPRLQGASDGASKRPDVGVGVFRNDLHQSQRKRPALQRLPHLAGPNNVGKKRQMPSLSGSDGSGVGYGRGIFSSHRRENLYAYFQTIAERLQRVRIICGDFARALTPAVTTSHGLTGVFLDPPYDDRKRAQGIYAHDDAEDASRRAREWAIEHGEDPHLRIALSGYDTEHGPHMPTTWRCHAWKANGGFGNRRKGGNGNALRERIWFSPWCLGGSKCSGPLFERLEVRA